MTSEMSVVKCQESEASHISRRKFYREDVLFLGWIEFWDAK
jgi:hypothetical protein